GRLAHWARLLRERERPLRGGRLHPPTLRAAVFRHARRARPRAALRARARRRGHAGAAGGAGNAGGAERGARVRRGLTRRTRMGRVTRREGIWAERARGGPAAGGGSDP